MAPSAGFSIQSASSSEDNDDNDYPAYSDAEVTGVRQVCHDQRSGLDNGAEKTPALESAPTAVWRKPQNKKSSLRVFFQPDIHMERTKKRPSLRWGAERSRW